MSTTYLGLYSLSGAILLFLPKLFQMITVFDLKEIPCF